ncbi:acyl-CoA dehydrogenase family protein [Chloroflexota bacterium]
MDYIITDLTEEQKQIKTLVRQFCKREVDARRMKELVDKASTAINIEELRAIQPLDLVEKLHDTGLHQLAVPTKYGGGGADYLTRVIACEEAGYSGGIVGSILSMAWMYCANLADYPVTEAQRDWFYPQFMENPTMTLAEATSEPHGNTDMHIGYEGPGVQSETFACKDGDEWVLNGSKMFSSYGGVADLIMVLARTDKQRPLTQSLSYFWVKKDTPGMTMEANRMLVDFIGGNVQIHLDNVRVPESHLVGELNNGYCLRERSVAMRMLPMAVFLGSAQKLYEEMREYAKERIQGGKPIIEHSNMARMLGEAGINLEAARAFIRKAAWENDWREKAGQPVNVFWTEAVRYYVKKMCWRLCEIASDVYGGMASSVDMPVESFVRQAYCMQHLGGTTEMNALLCSKYYDCR